jgi:hypothetical protein
MSNSDQDRGDRDDHGRDNRDDDHGHDEDNGDNAVTPTPTGGALTSLQALEAALRSVDTSAIAGHSGLPMLHLKREGNGTWMYGQKRTVVEDGSLWAANPATFMWGWVCFEGRKKLGGHLVSVSKPRPDVTTLHDYGVKWQEEVAVNMKAIGGADDGLEVVLKMSTDGGVKAINGLLNEVLDRVLGGQHGGKVVPIVRLGKDSYPHNEHGRVWYPVMTIVDWMPLEGPAPTPAPAPTPPSPTSPSSSSSASSASSASEPQPRRRRVA